MDRLNSQERIELERAFVTLYDARTSKFTRFYKQIFKNYPNLIKKFLAPQKSKRAI